MKSPIYTYKKANYLFNIHDTFTCGIMLEGWEVKSLDDYKGDINVAFCAFKNKDFCLLNCKITPGHNHTLDDTISNKEKRNRVLLLTKQEVNRIKDKIRIKGYSCIPLKLYRNKNGIWKLDIGLTTGKTNYDKRETIKKRDIERDMKRES